MEAFTIGKRFKASTTALVKKDIKPKRTPCFFSKLSLYCARNSITAFKLTSLKVVNMAAVCCDCTKRSAILARKRSIGTRRSSRSPATAGAVSTVALSDAIFAGDDALAVFSRVDSINAITSSLVKRPSLPVPAICSLLNSFSDRTSRTAGPVATADDEARAALEIAGDDDSAMAAFALD